MSYSFTVTAADKVVAMKEVEAKMAEVVAGQPMHARDKEQACCAAGEVVNLLHDDSTKDVVVSLNGSLGWSGGPGSEEITSACINASAYLATRAQK